MNVSVLEQPIQSPWERTLAWLKTRPLIMPTESLIVLVSVYFSVFGNTAFWKAAAPDAGHWGWRLSLFLLVTAVHGILLSALVWRRGGRLVLSVLILIAAMAGHYMSAYGIYIDAGMVKNVINTDWREANDLAGFDAVWPLLHAAPMVALVWYVRLRPSRWTGALLARVVLLVAMAVTGLTGALISSQQLSAFIRNQREVRYLVTPANVLVSLTKVISQDPPGSARAQLPIGEDAKQLPSAVGRRPRLLVLVVGETARAANWGLNGYARHTTPELAQRNVLNFPHVRSCGSSTEVSLPCMFSVQGREHYDEGEIRSHQSLLHVLQRAGVDVLWRDNQSGCKGVCSGLAYEDFRNRTDPGICQGNRCFDSILVEDLPLVASKAKGDQIIVLHMLGNHGPNYFERYPESFRRFAPVCENSDLGKCSQAQIVNAYDNALLYTDHVLATAIDELGKVTDRDTALLYVSDHGESLGENGLYLHGMPYAIAPREQVQVPMVAWFSEGWRQSTGLSSTCLQMTTGESLSHDNLFHTVLGLTGVKTALYRSDRDIFRGCRRAS